VKVRHSLAGLNLGGRIIFKWILGELDERAWTAFVQLRIGKMMGFHEHYEEPWCSIILRDLLRDFTFASCS
jgi:hypothetical protein